MIDLHSHVLPGVDDGPRTVEGSIALAKAAAESATTELVATPHVTWDIPTSSATVHEGVAALQAELDAAGIALRLRTGGEVAISRAVELDEEELAGLRLGGGEWLLAECPLAASAAGFDQVLLHLQARGHRIVLAHPERSPTVHRDPSKLANLVDAGVLTQVTAGSLTGTFGSTVQRFTYELIEQGLVHNIASDAHDLQGRPPGMAEAIAHADREMPGFADLAEWLTVEVPRAVLDGGPVPRPPAPPPRRRRRGLLRRAVRRR